MGQRGGEDAVIRRPFLFHCFTVFQEGHEQGHAPMAQMIAEKSSNIRR